MRYQIVNGTVSIGQNVILSHIDFEIKGAEKIAVVGKNGSGKTTLLRLIAGDLDLDRDDKRQGPGIQTDRVLTVGMLKQSNAGDFEKTIEELLLEGCPEKDTFSKERFLYEMEYDRLFTGFGFDKSMKKRKLSTFSGGEQTKISLIRLILEKPDILLLDEPTNHLDIHTVEWLEQYMKSYDRAVVFVSHDRFFLDQVVNTVYELSNGKLKKYAGNYTAYRKQKRKDIELQNRAYERQQEEIKRLNELIDKFKNKAKKSSFAKSRKTILERMEKIDKAREDDAHIFTGAIEPLTPSGKWVLEAKHLKLGYEEAFLELSVRVKRGQKIAVIGDNGSGKSTFLKTIAGILPPKDGTFSLDYRVLMGYFDQQSASLVSDLSVLTHFHNLFPAMTEKEIRQTLGAYLFRGADVSKKVSDLSGGEKSRLLLAELICSKPNLLLLDEPTNHMDIPAKETLESAFQAYTGTLIFVSHDRYFVEQVADAILVFNGNNVMYYPFGYEHYITHLRKFEGENLPAMIEAENQALIADLKAVPQAEKHRLKEIGTEEAYVDWKLRLAAEPLGASKDAYEALYEKWKEEEEGIEQEEWMQLIADKTCSLGTRTNSYWNQLEEAGETWTSECLKWYDLYLSLLG